MAEGEWNGEVGEARIKPSLGGSGRLIGSFNPSALASEKEFWRAVAAIGVIGVEGGIGKMNLVVRARGGELAVRWGIILWGGRLYCVVRAVVVGTSSSSSSPSSEGRSCMSMDDILSFVAWFMRRLGSRLSKRWEGVLGFDMEIENDGEGEIARGTVVGLA